MRFLLSVQFLCVVCLVLCAGCGGSDRAPLGKVSGTVSYQGQPIVSGTIIFEVAGARPANGKIVDGQIAEVTTHEPNDGVPIGQAKIAVFATSVGDAGGAATPGDPGTLPSPGQNYMDAGAQSLIPAKYNDPSTSGLKEEIKKGENTITLDLTG